MILVTAIDFYIKFTSMFNMRCVFCKNESSLSISVEHIIPQSLGNTKNFLPKGIVCDSCNNYFALKIEKPLLEQPFFKNLRARNWISNKKGRIPSEDIRFIGAKEKSIVHRSKKDKTPIEIDIDTDFFSSIINNEITELIFPTEVERPEEDNKIIARFIGKVGVETLAQILYLKDGGLEYLTDDKQFDPIREYVRFERSHTKWCYYTRKIYDETGDIQYNPKGYKPKELMYEYNLFYTTQSELYICIIIKGHEFTLNMGGPSIDGYMDWLIENNNASPLYIK